MCNVSLTLFSRTAGFKMGTSTYLRLAEILRKSPCTYHIHFFLPSHKRSKLAFLSCSWGESAGAVSVGTHLVANGSDAENLFRAAFMESGSPSPNGDITDGQPQYDALVSATKCAGASDTLACSGAASFDAIKAAMDASPGLFSYEVSITWTFYKLKCLFPCHRMIEE